MSTLSNVWHFVWVYKKGDKCKLFFNKDKCNKVLCCCPFFCRSCLGVRAIVRKHRNATIFRTPTSILYRFYHFSIRSCRYDYVLWFMLWQNVRMRASCMQSRPKLWHWSGFMERTEFFGSTYGVDGQQQGLQTCPLFFFILFFSLFCFSDARWLGHGAPMARLMAPI